MQEASARSPTPPTSDSLSEPESVEAEDVSPKREPEPFIEIQHVEETVGEIESNIRQLADTTNNLNSSSFSNDLPSARDFLNKLNKQVLTYEENLTQVSYSLRQCLISKELLQLDGISDPAVRTERRKAIGNINNLLDDVGELKTKVNRLRESVNKRLEEQEQERVRKGL